MAHGNDARFLSLVLVLLIWYSSISRNNLPPIHYDVTKLVTPLHPSVKLSFLFVARNKPPAIQMFTPLSSFETI